MPLSEGETRRPETASRRSGDSSVRAVGHDFQARQGPKRARLSMQQGVAGLVLSYSNLESLFFGERPHVAMDLCEWTSGPFQWTHPSYKPTPCVERKGCYCYVRLCADRSSYKPFRAHVSHGGGLFRFTSTTWQHLQIIEALLSC